MVLITIAYQGGLRCEATHGPSQSRLFTDAPLDNQGKGEAFSPTDLVATALGTCILTTMGIVAQRHGWSLEGATASVVKEMVADPVRRIGRLRVVLQLPTPLEAKSREALERAAHTCPVQKSLAEIVDVPVEFRWGSA